MLRPYLLCRVMSFMDRSPCAFVMCASMLLLLGCANTEPSRMALTQLPGQPTLMADFQSAICVRNVAGGEDAMELMSTAFGRVKTSDFREALTTTLRNVRMLETGG